ncbi:MAG: hypothetical protein KDA75_15945, partial [Planctomycetaceae bacterium]|nr:hypothetical protein [Planctomycetaceae bacterium]
MKQIRPLSLLVLLMVGKPAWAQFSSGPETETKQALVRINGIGHLEVAELIAVPVCEFQEATRTVTVQVAKVEVYSVDVEFDGRKLPETRTRTVCVPEQRQETYLRRNCKLVVKQAQHFCALDDRNGTFVRGSDHREIKLFEIDGTPVAPAQLGHRLKDWTLVLLTHNGQMAAGLYSGLYKPGTLVIAIPAPLQMAPTPPPQPDNVPPPPVAAPQPTPIPIAAPAPQPAADESRFNFPAGVPPTTVFSRVTGDSIVVRYHTDVTEFTSLLSKVSKTVDGKEVWEEICLPVEHTDRKSQVWKIPVSSVRGWSGDGTALSPAKLREKLNVEIPVLATV